MPIDLVIFDCDGVLVDSEVISCRAHAETLRRHGYPITEEQVLDRFLGRSMRHSLIEVEAELGRRLPDDFQSQVYSEIFRLFSISLQATPHMAETLTRIAEPVCVASSGPPEKISASLNHVNLYDRFAPHIFSAVQVSRGKPAPDLFLFAAKQMRTAPARCLVIEDSLAGIEAALTAGMAVLGFHGNSHCGLGYSDKLRAAGAHGTFDDMRQLPALIAEIQGVVERI